MKRVKTVFMDDSSSGWHLFLPFGPDPGFGSRPRDVHCRLGIGCRLLHGFKSQRVPIFPHHRSRSMVHIELEVDSRGQSYYIGDDMKDGFTGFLLNRRVRGDSGRIKPSHGLAI